MNTFVRMLEPVQAAVKKSLPASQRARARGNAPSHPKPHSFDRSFDDTTNSDRLTRLIACANAHPARIVGITGEKSGVGASATARQLATAYARFGKKVLLVDASRASVLASDEETLSDASLSLVEHATPLRLDISYVDLAASPPLAWRTAAGLRDMLSAAADEGYAVIVDLPPVTDPDDGSLAAFSTRGAACDLVFLVCLSGETTQKSLTRCVDTCEVAGVKLGGLVLNDWKLPMSSLLEG